MWLANESFFYNNKLLYLTWYTVHAKHILVNVPFCELEYSTKLRALGIKSCFECVWKHILLVEIRLYQYWNPSNTILEARQLYGSGRLYINDNPGRFPTDTTSTAISSLMFRAYGRFICLCWTKIKAASHQICTVR